MLERVYRAFIKHYRDDFLVVTGLHIFNHQRTQFKHYKHALSEYFNIRFKWNANGDCYFAEYPTLTRQLSSVYLKFVLSFFISANKSRGFFESFPSLEEDLECFIKTRQHFSLVKLEAWKFRREMRFLFEIYIKRMPKDFKSEAVNIACNKILLAL